MLGACSRSPTHAPSPLRPSNESVDKNAGTAVIASSPPISLDELASEGPAVAPLMREVLRADLTPGQKAEIVVDHDLCLRAAFASNEPARAWFEDGSGARRGEATHATHDVVPPRGPVCATKGETLRLIVSGPPNVVARAVIWSS